MLCRCILGLFLVVLVVWVVCFAISSVCFGLVTVWLLYRLWVVRLLRFVGYCVLLVRVRWVILYGGLVDTCRCCMV